MPPDCMKGTHKIIIWVANSEDTLDTVVKVSNFNRGDASLIPFCTKVNLDKSKKMYYN